MHALHRTMLYMDERLEYYKRRQEALLYPDRVWSLIGDGMAQHHCQLPVKVVDILGVPDYFFYLSPCMDNKFGRYCKTTWTQLQ